MKDHFVFPAAAAGLAALFMTGCCTRVESGCECSCADSRPKVSSLVRQEVIAPKATAPVVIDGKLDEADWKNAPAYTFAHPGGQYDDFDWDIQEFFAKGVVEPGRIRVLWDDKYLYVGVDFTDRDIHAEFQEDQKHFYRAGDVAEIFLKPANRPGYWELYVSPLGHKTAFHYPGRGTLGLPSGFQEKLPLKGMKTAAVARGTVNDTSDHDTGWTAEMAIPRDELVDAALDPEVPWLIFFGRYNYGVDLLWKETSCFPKQPMLNYHNHAGYAALKMVDKTK